MISYIVCHVGMICASTVLPSTRSRKFALTQPLYSDARLRLCWFLALFAVLVRESFLLSRTVGHSPYRLKSSKSALCKHSTFFLFQPARLIAYAHFTTNGGCIKSLWLQLFLFSVFFNILYLFSVFLHLELNSKIE